MGVKDQFRERVIKYMKERSMMDYLVKFANDDFFAVVYGIIGDDGKMEEYLAMDFTIDPSEFTDEDYMNHATELYNTLDYYDMFCDRCEKMDDIDK